MRPYPLTNFRLQFPPNRSLGSTCKVMEALVHVGHQFFDVLAHRPSDGRIYRLLADPSGGQRGLRRSIHEPCGWRGPLQDQFPLLTNS